MMGEQPDLTLNAAMISKGYRAPRLGFQMIKTGSSVNEKKKGKETDEGCTHCGNPKHTRDTYFKLHGYPEWWEDLKKNRTDPWTNPG